jgi:hypothetical protein
MVWTKIRSALPKNCAIIRMLSKVRPCYRVLLTCSELRRIQLRIQLSQPGSVTASLVRLQIRKIMFSKKKHYLLKNAVDILYMLR